MFVINCKNYEEISGDKIKKFIKIAEQVSKKYKIKIAKKSKRTSSIPFNGNFRFKNTINKKNIFRNIIILFLCFIYIINL